MGTTTAAVLGDDVTLQRSLLVKVQRLLASSMEDISNQYNFAEVLSSLSGPELEMLMNLTGLQSIDKIERMYRMHGSRDLMQFQEYRIHKILILYVSPVILLLGTLGNTFSFVVLRRKSMINVSSYFYLACLAVTDTMVLYVGLFRLWLKELTGTDLQSTSDWLCKLSIFYGYVSSDLSVWLIIAVTVERYIVVCFPFRATSMCNVSRAKRVVAFLCLLIASINLHFLWTVQVNEQGCAARQEFEMLVHGIWQWVDACIYSFCPFVIIMVLNLLIIREVMGAQSNRLRLSGSETEPSVNHQDTTGSSRHQTGEGSKITVMLLTVSFTFLVLTLPVNALLIFGGLWNQNAANNVNATDKLSAHHEVARFTLVKAIVELCMHVNHSINFFLYCATGNKFRQQVILLFRCIRASSCCCFMRSPNEDRTHRRISSSLMGGNSEYTTTSRYFRRKSSTVSFEMTEDKFQSPGYLKAEGPSSANSHRTNIRPPKSISESSELSDSYFRENPRAGSQQGDQSPGSGSVRMKSVRKKKGKDGGPPALSPATCKIYYSGKKGKSSSSNALRANDRSPEVAYQADYVLMQTKHLERGQTSLC